MEKESESAVHMVKEFLHVLNLDYAGWKEAYFRFVMGDRFAGGEASCVVGDEVVLMDTWPKTLWNDIFACGEELLMAAGVEAGVLLLVVKDNQEFDIHLDFADPDRWEITKMDGGTGIPKDIPKD